MILTSTADLAEALSSSLGTVRKVEDGSFEIFIPSLTPRRWVSIEATDEDIRSAVRSIAQDRPSEAWGENISEEVAASRLLTIHIEEYALTRLQDEASTITIGRDGVEWDR